MTLNSRHGWSLTSSFGVSIEEATHLRLVCSSSLLCLQLLLHFNLTKMNDIPIQTAKKMGTTNSAPVFDRSVDPPLFLGVVASDVHMDAFEQVLGENAQSSTMLQRFIRLSTAQCPKIDLSDCQLEGLRYLAGGEEATCGICNSTDYPGIIPTECPFKPDLPKNLWQNTDGE